VNRRTTQYAERRAALSQFSYLSAKIVFRKETIMNAIAQERQQPSEIIDVVCCACHKVAWNGADGTEPRRWVDAGVYAVLVGALSDLVSHGMCPDCIEEYWKDAFPGAVFPSTDVNDNAGSTP
jgi:hypothetical protein